MKKETITLVAIIGVVALAIYFYTSPRVIGIPQDHSQIINDLDVVEVGTSETFSLSSLCVDSGSRVFGENWPLSIFETGETYTQSTWIWQREGDTEACLTVWGPGDDGKTYDLELSRLVGALEIRVYYEGVLQRSMPKVTMVDAYDVMPGYVWFNVVLE